MATVVDASKMHMGSSSERFDTTYRTSWMCLYTIEDSGPIHQYDFIQLERVAL